MTQPAASEPRQFERLRGRLFGIAYRMLGSRAEAEDVVQDAFVRWHQADQDAIRNAEAWLVTTTTRIAIDRLRALKTAREAYVGPWLPEPLIGQEPPPDREVEIASDLSVAFLVLLERLAPEERAAFLLHDIFDCDYSVLADALGKTEVACRQTVRRARERVQADRKRFAVSEAARVRMLRTFVEALQARDEKALLALFAPDATWIADGGGRAMAVRRPLVGAQQLTKFVLWLQARFAEAGASLHLAAVNGETGLVARLHGDIRSVMTISTDGDRILAVHAIVNPEKLPPAFAH